MIHFHNPSLSTYPVYFLAKCFNALYNYFFLYLVLYIFRSAMGKSSPRIFVDVDTRPVKVLFVINFQSLTVMIYTGGEILHQHPVEKQLARNENRDDWKQCRYHLSIRNWHRFCKKWRGTQLEGTSPYRIRFVVLNVQDAVVSKLDSSIQQINPLSHHINTTKTLWVPQWEAIYPLDSAMHPWNNWGQDDIPTSMPRPLLRSRAMFFEARLS